MRLLALVPVLVCLAPLLGWTAEDADGPREAVAAALADVRATSPNVRSEGLARLRELGPEALPALVETLASQRDGDPASEAVASAIREHGYRALEKTLRRAIESQDDTKTRLVALRVLGRVSGAEALPFAVEVVNGIESSMLLRGHVKGAWRIAFRGLLCGGTTRLAASRVLHDVTLPLRAPTARVLAEAGRPNALAGLVDFLGSQPGQAAPLLGHLCRAPRLAVVGIDAEDMLRGYLNWWEGPARIAAAEAAAHLGVRALLPELIELLAVEDVRCRRAAQKALRALTGTMLGSRPDAWQAWLEAERKWVAASNIGSRLRSRDPSTLSQVLREVTMHPFGALSALPDLTMLKRHDSPGVRLGAVAALRTLNRPEAASALVSFLDDDEPTVRAAAHQALMALSGERLDASAEDWSRLLADHS